MHTTINDTTLQRKLRKIDERIMRDVEHKAVPWVKNHNEEKVFPDFPKRKELRNDFLPSSLLSICEMLRFVAPAPYNRQFGQWVVEMAKAFVKGDEEARLIAASKPAKSAISTSDNVMGFMRKVNELLEPAGIK